MYCRSDKGLGVFTGSKEYFLWVFFFLPFIGLRQEEREKRFEMLARLEPARSQPCSHVTGAVTILLARTPVFKESNRLTLILSLPVTKMIQNIFDMYSKRAECSKVASKPVLCTVTDFYFTFQLIKFQRRATARLRFISLLRGSVSFSSSHKMSLHTNLVFFPAA